MIIYVNILDNEHRNRETLGQVDTRDFPSLAAFREECKLIIQGCHAAGMPVYLSSRCCKNWKE